MMDMGNNAVADLLGVKLS